MKYLLILVFLFSISLSYGQEKFSNLKIGLGSSFFNINENFDDIFLFNNSSPIIIGLKSERLRLESTTNISLSTRENNSTFVRGSIRLSIDYFKEISSKMKIYFGPQYGLNTNETHLINLHVGGEYFLHKNWSISNQIGLNFLFDNESESFIQTNSSIILRFYLDLKKKTK